MSERGVICECLLEGVYITPKLNSITFRLQYNVDNSVNDQRVHLEEIYNDQVVDGYSYHESVGLLILLHRTVSTIRIQCGDREFENRVLGYFSQLGNKSSSYNKLGVNPTVLDKFPKYAVTKKRIGFFKVSTVCVCLCVFCVFSVCMCVGVCVCEPSVFCCAVRVLCVCCIQ